MDTDSNKITWVVVIVAAVAIMGGLFVKFVPNMTSQMQSYVQTVTGKLSDSSSVVDSSSNSDFTYSDPDTTDNTISIVGYSGHEENLSIPQYRKIGSVSYKITAIGNYAFKGNTSIRHVTISDDVRTIGSGAFYSTDLTSVALPAGLTSIGAAAFYSTDLTSVALPDGLTSIGNFAFYSTDLTSVALPAGLTSIGNNAFSYTKLTSVDFPAGLTSIGDYAFANTDLTNVDFPAGLTSIGDHAFNSTPISAISFRKRVDLGYGSFAQTKLTNVTLPTGSTYETNADSESTFDSNVNVTIK